MPGRGKRIATQLDAADAMKFVLDLIKQTKWQLKTQPKLDYFYEDEGFNMIRFKLKGYKLKLTPIGDEEEDDAIESAIDDALPPGYILERDLNCDDTMGAVAVLRARVGTADVYPVIFFMYDSRKAKRSVRIDEIAVQFVNESNKFRQKEPPFLKLVREDTKTPAARKLSRATTTNDKGARKGSVLAYLESHRRTIEPHIRSVADQTDIQVMNDLDLASPVGIDCKLAIDAMAGYLVIADSTAFG